MFDQIQETTGQSSRRCFNQLVRFWADCLRIHAMPTEDDRAGDLLIGWKDSLRYDAISYGAEGESVIVRAPNETPGEGRGLGWSGTHRPEGVFLVWGPGINEGATIEGVTGYDIAPMVPYLQNLPIATDMDGRVLTDVFN